MLTHFFVCAHIFAIEAMQFANNMIYEILSEKDIVCKFQIFLAGNVLLTCIPCKINVTTRSLNCIFYL